MEKVYIIAAKRTAIGSLLGALKPVPAVKLGAETVKALLKETGIAPDQVDELICGNVLSAGCGQGPARQVALGAGLPKSMCAYAVNMVCGSGLKAVMNGMARIQLGDAEIVIAGGAESMSNAPYLLPPDTRSGIKMGDYQVKDHMVFDALTDAFDGIHMGITAENIAAKYGITRLQQDDFAYQSQQKAIAAVDSGIFKPEIVPIEVKTRKDTVMVTDDEHPNRKSTPEKLAGLRSVFQKDGTVTAGNASGVNDGAAFVLLAGERAVKKLGLTPMMEIVAAGQGGVEPSVMGLGPVPAIGNALLKAGSKLQDMELIELNEAFAAQSLGVVRELSEEHDMSMKEILARTNVRGGAIALGHPVGASGCRILVTLVHAMQQTGARQGLASLCIGGGMGTAVIVRQPE